MKIDIISVLNEEYPNFLDGQDVFVYDHIKDFPNSEIHQKKLKALSLKDKNYIERVLLKEILECVCQMGFDPSCEYFSAVTKRFSADVRNGSKKVIVIDDLFKSGLIDLFILVFTWAKDISDRYNFEYCFVNMLYLLDMKCVKKTVGTIDDEEDRKWHRSLDESILSIASDCYWVSLCFVMSHEIGHLVLGHTEKINNENNEYDADKFAFDLIIKLIKKNKNSKDEILSVFTEYICFAPMMLLDFYRIISFYKSLLYPNKYPQLKPEPEKRIQRLIDIGIDEFDIAEGNTVYSNFLDVVDLFTEQLTINLHSRTNMTRKAKARQEFRRFQLAG